MSYKGSAERLQKRNTSLRRLVKDTRSLKMVMSYVCTTTILDGHPIGAKIRTKNKVFSYEGESDGSFFGQHLFFRNSKGNSVVITEGELDAAS